MTVMYKILALCLLLPALSHAQPSQSADDEDDPYEKKSYFMFGLDYLNNNVYLGRKDSVTVPYIAPFIGLHDKSGLYAKGSVSYASGSLNKRIDVATLEAGYEHSFGDINGGAMIDKYFYNKNSRSIRANTKGSGSVYAQYNNDWIEPQVTFDVNINKASTDYVVAAALDHNFTFFDKTLQIAPTVSVNSGTQNYYEEYLRNRITKNDKTVKVKKIVANTSGIMPLDYEFQIKTTYRIGKWLMILTPTYAIPVNPSTLTLPGKKGTVTEKLSNSFFFELNICHR